MTGTALDYNLLLKESITDFIESTRLELVAEFEKFTTHKNYNDLKNKIYTYKQNISTVPNYQPLLDDLEHLELQISLLEGSYVSKYVVRKIIRGICSIRSFCIIVGIGLVIGIFLTFVVLFPAMSKP